MPKRSNEFQRLVTLVQGTMAPKGAKVTESEIVDIPGLDGGREIDVLIQGSFGMYSIKVAVEAKDHSRKMDLPTFESIVGKYTGEGRVPVQKVVVITRQGFTDNVIAKAKMLDIELLTLTEAFDTDWSRFGPQEFSFQMAPHLCGVFFEPPIPGEWKQILAEGRRVCCHGCPHETIGEFVEKLLRNHILPNNPELFNQLCAKAAEEESGQAEARITAGYDGLNWSVSYGERQYPFSSITIRFHAIVAKGVTTCSELAMTAGDGQQQRLLRVQASAGDKTFELVIPASQTPPDKVALRIDDDTSYASAEPNA